MGEVRIGIAGWVFEPWRGEFYPQGLKQKEELAFASSALRTIEINATFYSTQKPSSFRNWAAQTPDDFVFTLKGPKFITHQIKLKDAGAALADFFASGPLALGAKLGPVCWQLPPNLRFDPERFESFFSLLPQTAVAAAELARGHSPRIKEPHLDAAGVAKVRHAVEVRDVSFADPAFLALLRRHNIALITADTVDWPYADTTADFAYARLQGPPVDAEEPAYSQTDLDALAARIRAWQAGQSPVAPQVAPEAATRPVGDVFAFFVHTDKVHAPRNAQALMARLGVAAPACWPR